MLVSDEIKSKVVSVVDGYIENHNPRLRCSNSKKQFEDIKRSVTSQILLNEHGIVHDRNGNLVCRPHKFTMDPIIRGTGGEHPFSYYCNLMRFKIQESIKSLPGEMRPNMFVALGGAKNFSWGLIFSLRNAGVSIDMGSVTMEREPKGEGGFDFVFEPNHHIPELDTEDLSGMNVFIIEDFIFTGTSVDRAIEKIKRHKGKVRGVISFTNSLARYWTFGVAANITFLNLSYQKYPAGQCPICKAA